MGTRRTRTQPAPDPAPAPDPTVLGPAGLPRRGDAVDVTGAADHDRRFWSVTTIIGVLDKPALVPWAALATATAAVDDRKVWQARLANEGRDSAVDYLKNARFRRPRSARSAAKLGTDVHAACETWALTGTRPDVDDELAPFLYQFGRFLDAYQPAYEAAEITVYDPDYGYAGTLDAVAALPGCGRVVLDYKTSAESFTSTGKPKGPYPEVGLQLAALRYAPLAAVWRARRMESFRRRYYLLSDTEADAAVAMPELDGGVALGLYPDRYALHPVRCDREIHEAFLYLIEAARWAIELAPTVIGDPLVPPGPLDESDPFAGLPA